MAKLAKDWLASSYTITRQLEPLERCISDGYILTSVCHQQGLIDDMDFEQYADSTPGPDSATENFKLLAKALRKVNLKITKKDVADLMTEQAGSAPTLIMQMKRAFEAGGNQRVRTPEYKNAIKTLRPHKFVRTRTKEAEMTPEDRYYNDIVMSHPDMSKSRVAVPIVQAAQYEAFRYSMEQQEDFKEQEAAATAKAAFDERYRTKLENDHLVHHTHEEKASTLAANHRKTQLVKRQRNIRDTQFELAVQTRRDLKQLYENMQHDKEQINDINAFEFNLKRQGYGGGEEGRPLSISYEDPEAYLVRIENLTKAKLPSREETNDFVMSLKQRTAQTKFSRLEKARRKRRMLVEQRAAQKANELAATMNQVDDEDALLEEEEKQARLEKATAKQERIDMLTEESRAKHCERMAVAEDKLRIFFEEHRLLADDSGENVLKYKEVCTAQEARKTEKRAVDTEYVKSVVLDLVKNAFFIAEGDGPASPVVQSVGVEKVEGDVVKSIIDSVHTLSSSGASESNNEYGGFLHEVIHSELWPMYASLASSIGSKRMITEVENPSVQEDAINLRNSAETLQETPKGDPVTEDAAVAAVHEDKEFTTGTPGEEGGSALSSIAQEGNSTVVEGPDAKVEDDSVVTEVAAHVDKSPTVITKIESQESLITSVQMICESLFVTEKQNNYSHICLNEQERQAYSSGDRAHVILVLGQGNLGAIDTWRDGLRKINSTTASTVDVIENWDVLDALIVAEKMQPLLVPEGKAKEPVINLQQLAGLFARTKSIEMPTSFQTDMVPTEIIQKITEIIETFGNIERFEKITAEEGSADHLTDQDFTFDDVHLFSLLGQVLWVREYVRKGWGADCPFSTFVLASRSYGRSSDSGMSSAVFDWFLKGGNRDNIPDAEEKLRSYVQTSFEKYDAGKKGKPPPKKGKGAPEEDPIPLNSALSGLIWIKSSYNSKKILGPEQVYKVVEEGVSRFNSCLNRYEFCRNHSDNIVNDGLVAENDAIEYITAHPEMMSATCIMGAEDFPPQWACSFAERDIHLMPIGNDFVLCEVLLAMMSCIVSGESLGTLKKSPASADPQENNDEHESEKKEEDSSPISLFNTKQALTIHDMVRARRKLLTPAKACKLSHIAREEVLDSDGMFKVLQEIYSLQRQEVAYTGGLLSAAFETLDAFNSTLRQGEASLISNFKSFDPRWESYCADFDILGMDKDENVARIATNDLLCSLGDTLDQRHMQWISQVNTFDENTMSEAFEVMIKLNDISKVLSKVFSNSYAKQQKCIEEFVSMLEQAGYSSIPFNLPSKFIKGGRTSNLARKKDMLKSEVLSMNEIISSDQTDINLKEMWSSVVEESASSITSSQALQDAQTELMFNTLDKSLCIVVAFKHTIERLNTACLDCNNSLNATVLLRHKYEHAYLSKWGTDLMNNLNNLKEAATASGVGERNTISRQSSITSVSQLIFKPSFDRRDDGIVWKDGMGVLELGEMTLSMTTIKEFAIELKLQKNSLNESSNFISFVNNCVKGMLQKNKEISYPWKNSDNIKKFIKSCLKTFQVDSNDDTGSFDKCEILINYLILGILPKSFVEKTITFLISEGKKLMPDDPVNTNIDDDKDTTVRNEEKDEAVIEERVKEEDEATENVVDVATEDAVIEQEAKDVNEENIGDQPREITINKVELIKIPAGMYLNKIRASSHFDDEYGKMNAPMYLGAVEATMALYTTADDMICINDFAPFLCRSVITPSCILFENQLICCSNVKDEEESTTVPSLYSPLPFTSVPFNYRPGVIKMGLLSKLLKAPLNADRLPHELNGPLGTHVDMQQLVVYLDGLDANSVVDIIKNTCTLKCAKIAGREDMKSETMTYETFAADVMFLSELPQNLGNFLTSMDESGTNTSKMSSNASFIRSCELVYQDL